MHGENLEVCMKYENGRRSSYSYFSVTLAKGSAGMALRHRGYPRAAGCGCGPRTLQASGDPCAFARVPQEHSLLSHTPKGKVEVDNWDAQGQECSFNFFSRL